MGDVHWTVEHDPVGWVLRYHPKSHKNDDGSTTYSVNFPALQLTEWVAEPEAVANDIARDLNCHDDLVAALKLLLDKHVALISSGDCGNWNAESTPEVKAARAALAKADAGTVRLGEIG
jgi:hypothetical protein